MSILEIIYITYGFSVGWLLFFSLYTDNDGKVHRTIQNKPTWNKIWQPLTLVWIFAVFCPYVNTLGAVTTLFIFIRDEIKRMFFRRKLKGTWTMEKMEKMENCESLYGIDAQETLALILTERMQEEMKIKLKDCPFCGYEVDIDDGDSLYPNTRPDKEGNASWHVGCYNPSCEAMIWGENKEDAIERWNTRSTAGDEK